MSDTPTGIETNPAPPNPGRRSRRPLIAAGIIIAFAIGVYVYKGISGTAWDTTPRAAEAKVIEPISSGEILAAPSTQAAPPPQQIQAPEPPEAPPDKVVRDYGRSHAPAYPREPIQVTYQQPPDMHKREATPEERAAERMRLAMLAPTSTQHQAPGIAPAAAITRTPGASSGFPGYGQPARSVEAAANHADEYMLANAQDRKRAFLSTSTVKNASNYLARTRELAIGAYELKAGWEIPAVLEQEMNSDLPGELKSMVTSNVYDTATGQYLLIPQGARLIGVYNSEVSYGQEGVQCEWDRIIFPDGSSVNLEGMTGMDASGRAGLRHKVDRHYKRTFGMALLTSLFAVPFALTQNRNRDVFSYPSAQEQAGAAVAREISQTGQQITRRNLLVQPTIKIPVGYRFSVRVNKDMLFETPYEAEFTTAEPEKPMKRAGY